MLLLGNGTDQDIQYGLKLLSASAEQGNVYAARFLQNYYSGRMVNHLLVWRLFRLLSILPGCLKTVFAETKTDSRGDRQKTPAEDRRKRNRRTD